MIAAARPGVRHNASTSVTFTDDFNRPDSLTTLSNGWVVGVSQAPTWLPIWGITSGRAYLVGRDPAHGVGTIPLAMRVTTSGEIDTSVQFTTAPATNEGLLFRCNAACTEYFYVGLTALQYFNASGGSALLGPGYGSIANGDTVRVTAFGNNITVFLNGVSVTSVSTANGKTNTQHGLIAKDTGGTVRFDNYSLTWG